MLANQCVFHAISYSEMKSLLLVTAERGNDNVIGFGILMGLLHSLLSNGIFIIKNKVKGFVCFLYNLIIHHLLLLFSKSRFFILTNGLTFCNKIISSEITLFLSRLQNYIIMCINQSHCTEVYSYGQTAYQQNMFNIIKKSKFGIYCMELYVIRILQVIYSKGLNF